MRRVFYLWMALGVAGVLAAMACGDTATSTVYIPVTGIVVRADSLVTGFGCGPGPTQVFRYAAVVVNQDNQPVVGATYSCFADGTFVNLQASDGGSLNFTVLIFAFNKDAYTAASGKIEGSASQPEVLRTLNPTWTSTCRATQQQDVQVLAVCEPLAPGPPSTVRVETAQFSQKDGGNVGCGAATTDGGAYQGVRASVTVKGATADAGEDLVVACPNPIRISPAIASAAYTVDVHLLSTDGGPEGGVEVGKTTCRAVAKPGIEVVAACDPVE